MRKKLVKEIKYVQIQITEEAHELITKKKARNKPIYLVVDEILNKYEEMENYKQMFLQQVEATKNWKTKYENLNKIKNY